MDGIYFILKHTDYRPYSLVIIGAHTNGKKEMLAIHDAEMESKPSWKTVLQDVKSLGPKKRS